MKNTFLKNISLRVKLISCFLLIIIINAVSGYISIRLVRDLSGLVNKTYDQALMSSTFAQSSKFNFSQFDSEIKSSLIEDDEDQFNAHVKRSKKAFKTLKEDLGIVVERTLSEKSSDLSMEIKLKLAEIQDSAKSITEQKLLLLNSDNNQKDSHDISQEWENLSLKKVLYRKIEALSEDAAVVGYQFRLASEESNLRNINRTIAIILSCILISVLLSVFMTITIIAPLFKLQNVCKIVGDGDYSVRSDIESKDELGTLSTYFNFMLNTIQDKTDNMTTLLSSLPFGLFYFDVNGKISKERSKSTDLILPDFGSYTTLYDFFTAHQCNSQQVAEIVRALFQKTIPFDSAVFLFPEFITSQERTIQLSFKPYWGKKKKLEKVIVIAEDVTEKNQALKESRELTERVERVSRVSGDIAGFKDFLPTIRDEFGVLLSGLDPPIRPTMEWIKRNLHTIKGLMGVYAFTTCSNEINDIETELAKNSDTDILILRASILTTQSLFETQANDIVSLLALNQDNNFRFYDVSKILEIKLLAQKLSNSSLNQALENLDKFPLEKVLAKYSNYAISIAKKLEDKQVNIIFDPSDEVSYEEVQRLDAVLIHVLNNSIDHGIESTFEREANQKKTTGEIHISCTRHSDHSLEFKISDDGKGINAEYLLEKAVRVGLYTQEQASKATETEKINLIFASGLSSKEEVSGISGRGVGMDAVKNYLESIGGSIQLFTERGIGTTFSFTVPSL